MDKVQNKPYSSVQHTPSSESFKVYYLLYIFVRSRVEICSLTVGLQSEGKLPVDSLTASRESALSWLLGSTVVYLLLRMINHQLLSILGNEIVHEILSKKQHKL
jgi:hypothetical protein